MHLELAEDHLSASCFLPSSIRRSLLTEKVVLTSGGMYILDGSITQFAFAHTLEKSQTDRERTQSNYSSSLVDFCTTKTSLLGMV